MNFLEQIWYEPWKSEMFKFSEEKLVTTGKLRHHNRTYQWLAVVGIVNAMNHDNLMNGETSLITWYSVEPGISRHHK